MNAVFEAFCFSSILKAASRLWRDRTFSLFSIAIIAVCSGTNITIFSVLNQALLAPLNFPEADRLVTTDVSYSNVGISHQGSSIPNYFEIKNGVSAFDGVGAYQVATALVESNNAPERVQAIYVSPSFFSVLGEKAAIGRLFLDDEGTYNDVHNWAVVVLSDGYWRRRFQADPKVLGTILNVEGIDRIIVGILPPTFHFLSTNPAIWATMPFSPEQRAIARRHNLSISLIERLRKGTSITTAQAQVDAVNSAQVAGDPNSHWAATQGFRTSVRSLHAAYVEKARPGIILVQAGVALLFAVGIINVSNLFLVRSSSRLKEIAVRVALGATPAHISAYYLLDASILSLAGSAGGLAIAVTCIYFLNLSGIAQLPLGGNLGLSPITLTVLGVAAVATSLLLSVPSIIVALRSNLAATLSLESRGGTSSGATVRFRYLSVVAQISMAFVLITTSALLTASFEQTVSVNPGFDPDHVMTAWIGFDWSRYKDPMRRNVFVNQWISRLQSAPRIDFVGLGTSMPVVGDFGLKSMVIEGHQLAADQHESAHHFASVAGEYFRALEIPLLQGRLLTLADATESNHVCVVDEDFVKQYWPTGSPLGYRVSLGKQMDETAFRIVGVVGSVKQDGLSERDPRGMVYVPNNSQYVPYRLAVLVRSSAPNADVIRAMRTTLSSVDPLIPLEETMSMVERIQMSIFLQRTIALLSITFAAFSLLLCAVGAYGVMAFTVESRRQEIGIRLALGAQPLQVVMLINRISAYLLIAGGALGVGLSLVSGRAMRSFLFNISPTEPAVLIGAVGVIALVLIIATNVPIRKTFGLSITELIK